VEDRARCRSRGDELLPDTDARLLEQIRSGDAEAGHRFVREHYTPVYRYLLYLSGQSDLAEDLTQETFLQGWRRLDTFQGRGSLRSWLYRIAHREFLHRQQCRQAALGLDGMVEVAAPDATAWMDSVELREVIDRLPLAQREVVLLHYLEGYSSAEIARIVEVPAGTVRYRLSQAREHLRQALGRDDLSYLNEPLAPGTGAAGGRQWAWLPLEQMDALEARLVMVGEKESEMERREFLRQAAAGAVGMAVSEPGKDVVDERLTQKVTLALKATALTDVCDRLRADTGVRVAAGPSVADEKVTLFCAKTPLREVMRQLSRPFGYTWLRSGEPRAYRYELAQDLRSQLLEEELRNRDRNQALLALEKEIDRYRPYLSLSPDEAMARAKTAAPEEKKLLEKLARYGWGPLRMYFRLSPHDLAALRAGQQLTFSAEPLQGQQPLPPELAGGVLQSFRDHRLVRHTDRIELLPIELAGPEGVPLTAAPEVHPLVTLSMQQSELGQFTIDGHSGVRSNSFYVTFRGGPYAVGQNPIVLKPESSRLNAHLIRDPTLLPHITVAPKRNDSTEFPIGSGELPQKAPPRPSRITAAKVTTAEVLEALHRATGLPLVADYYTRLYQPGDVSVQNLSVLETLNQLSETMHFRWRKEDGWLQFRSTSFYDDRTKEVPNRLLARWIASRRQHGALTLDDLIEIAQLPDAQLDGAAMAEGARDYFGLVDWDLASHRHMRPHLRFLGTFTPEQRQQAASAIGLAFTKMTLAQQQRFISLALPPDDPVIQSMIAPHFGSTRLLEELKQAVLRVEYTRPGWFQWGDPSSSGQWFHWVVPLKPGRDGWRVPRPSVRERTREAALQAVRRLDPQVRDAAVHARQLPGRAQEAERPIPLEAQIFPSELSLTVVYIPGASNALPIRTQYNDSPSWQFSW
jgi:RNA polymerase sigma factor (sigma-70 family)